MERERNSTSRDEGHVFIYPDGEAFSTAPLAEIWSGWPDGQQSGEDYDTAFDDKAEAYYHWQEDEEYCGRLNLNARAPREW